MTAAGRVEGPRDATGPTASNDDVLTHEDDAGSPSWSAGPIPDSRSYMESELFVAGAISTLPPFDQFHPAWALPFARQALDALSQWEPSDSFGADRARSEEG